MADADAAFLRGMIVHHAQAVEMARMAPSHDASAGVRRMAERTIASQEDEIARMADWLRERGLPETAGHGANHAGMGPAAHGADHAGMPGMLTPERMARLDAARGAEFDRVFLVSMIDHHRGAVEMVRRLLATPGAGRDPTVFRLASDVSADQTAEIGRMQRMLAALVIQGPTAP